MVAPPGFEPGARDPESRMMDHYTTGLASLQLHPVHKKSTLILETLVVLIEFVFIVIEGKFIYLFFFGEFQFIGEIS